MAENPGLVIEVDELSGEVVYMRPRLSDTRYLLGTKQEVMETMADFLAQQDYGEK